MGIQPSLKPFRVALRTWAATIPPGPRAPCVESPLTKPLSTGVALVPTVLMHKFTCGRPLLPLIESGFYLESRAATRQPRTRTPCVELAGGEDPDEVGMSFYCDGAVRHTASTVAVGSFLRVEFVTLEFQKLGHQWPCFAFALVSTDWKGPMSVAAAINKAQCIRLVHDNVGAAVELVVRQVS